MRPSWPRSSSRSPPRRCSSGSATRGRRLPERGSSSAQPTPRYTALSNVSDGFDPDVYRGRDRDRLVERSTAFVMVDEIGSLRLVRTLEAEQDLDSLKDRGIRPVPDAFDGGLDPIQANAAVPRPPLHQQHTARGNAR